MSLDVWLKSPAPCPHCGEATGYGDEVFSANITNNLNKMAEAAGIYEHLWKPEEIGITKALQLIDPLQTGLAKMKADPEKYKAYNSPNGWGLYENFVPWIEKYLAACEEYPESIVSVSR
jgi:hypothetical protein